MSQLHRVSGVLDLELIGKKKVLMIGLGSLGSLTLANLCYPFGEMVLIDPDMLEDKNVERHLLNPADVGKSKVVGCRNWMISRGVYPKRIYTYQGQAQDVLGEHTNADLVVMSVDNGAAKYAVNEFCAKHKIPLIVGGVYPLGNGGEVTTITDFENGCFRCVDHMFGRDLYLGKVTDYGLGESVRKTAEGDLKAVPALRGPVSEMAAVMAETALDILQEKAVINSIYLRAKDWTPIVNVGEKALLKILSEYVTIQGRIGLQPNSRLRVGADGSLALQVSDCSLRLQVNKWDRCPEHQQMLVSADEI